MIRSRSIVSDSVRSMGSLVGQHVLPPDRVSASPAYAAAKVGVLMLSRQAAREYAPHDVRINSISPGTVENGRILSMPPEMRAGLAASHPLGRIGVPEDVAGVAAYLLRDTAGWITGATLDVNGGFAML